MTRLAFHAFSPCHFSKLATNVHIYIVIKLCVFLLCPGVGIEMLASAAKTCLALKTLYIHIYFFCFSFFIFKKFFAVFFYVQKLVTGLTVRENDQIYEILG